MSTPIIFTSPNATSTAIATTMATNAATGTRLATIGPCITLADDQVSDAQFQALSLSLCWAQAVARTSHSDVNSQAYFDALCNELGRVAWTLGGSQAFSSHQSGASLRVASIVPGILKSLAGADTAAAAAQLFNSLQDTPVQPSLASMFSTWWSRQKATLLSQAFAVCPARIDPNGALGASLVFYAFDVQASSWQSFFVASQANSLDVGVRSCQLSLDAALWSSVSDAITQRLGAAAIAGIQQLSIDL